MTLAEQLTWSANADNISKVRQLLCKAAVAVMAESAATAGHDIRVAFAQAVIGNPAAAASAYVFAVATNSGLTTTPTDNDLEFTVNAMFNAFAGYAAA